MTYSSKHPPWHFGQYCSNQTVDWLPTDSEERFRESIKDPIKYEYLKNMGWHQPGAFTYKINSAGFRGDEFDIGNDCIVTLGCSYTIGTGLPQEQVWPWILGGKLGLPVCNLAWGGTSSDTCFRLAQYWLPKLKPKHVFMLTPPRDRVDVYTAGNQDLPYWETLMASDQSKIFLNDNFIKYWFSYRENQNINIEKNKLAIEMLAKNNNSGFAVLDADAESSTAKSNVGCARDFMHAGPVGHRALAEKMLNIANV